LLSDPAPKSHFNKANGGHGITAALPAIAHIWCRRGPMRLDKSGRLCLCRSWRRRGDFGFDFPHYLPFKSKPNPEFSILKNNDIRGCGASALCALSKRYLKIAAFRRFRRATSAAIGPVAFG